MNASPPHIPANAPFSPEQRAWLNGFLAGMFGAASAEGAEADAEAQAKPPVSILFGSQSGNAESLAKKLAKAAKKEGFQAEAIDMAAYEPGRLAEERALLVVTSTYGDGEPPDNARTLHGGLLSDQAPRLEGVRFGVLGLGDSNYPDFNQCAIEFDRRLEELGAERICESAYCDVDYEEQAETWKKAALSALAQDAGPAAQAEGEKRGQGEERAAPAAPEAVEPPAYTKRHPFHARIKENRDLNGPGSDKETRHIVFDLGSSGLAYQAGDALGTRPVNSARLVDAIIEAAGLPEDAPTPLPDGGVGPLFEALRFHYEISRLSESFVEACARLSEADRFRALVESKEAMRAYLHGRGVLEPLLEERPRFPSTEHLVAPLKRLQPRLYSIASSLLAHPGEVHLTVARLRWEARGQERLGVCSNCLAEAKPGQRLPVFVHPNPGFRPPADAATAAIMVGPGTGVAPFRAFVEERTALGHTGSNWLFFGDRRSACDFLYADELRYWQKRGRLARLDVAFSRDQDKKIYVQDRLREAGAELFRWLEEGAHFYVCGDASRMAKDVDAALREIVAKESGKGAEFAGNYVEELRAAKRYARDVY